MSLVYLYIDDYRNFKKQNINFGDKYFFTYNEHTKELKKEENKLYIEDFYSVKNTKTNTKISNVTGIVGANGSGKSSILSFLLGSSLNFMAHNGIHDFIMIYKKSECNYVVYHTENLHIGSLLDFELKKVENQVRDLIKDEVKINDLLLNDGSFIGIEDVYSVFMSNISDFNSFFSSTYSENVWNLSSSYMLSKEANKYLSDNFKIKISFTSVVLDDTKLIPFKCPEYFIIEHARDYWRLIVSGNASLIVKDKSLVFEEFRAALESITERFTSFGLYDNFFNRLYYNSYIELLSSDLLEFISFFGSNREYQRPLLERLSRIMSYLKRSIENIDKLNNEEFRNLILENFKHYVEVVKEENTSTWLEETVEFRMTFLRRIVEVKAIKTISGDKVEVELLEDSALVVEMYSKTTINFDDYLKFYFRDLSSGEGALLDIYSRFYSIREKINKTSSKNLTIILDEFDLYLHPHWQKKFLKTFIEFLTEIYIDKNIQIIFATNSPIPISDVLGYNMVFLETENGNSVVRTTLNEQHDTFAANIHTLYSDSFFVQDGLIGDLATTKINEVISYLKDKSNKNPFKNGTELRQFILQIGEPLIKNKLLTMYNDKYNLSIHTRLDEIEKRMGLDNDKD